MEPASSFAAEMALRSELDVVRLQRLKQAGQVNRLGVRQGTLPWPCWLLIGRSQVVVDPNPSRVVCDRVDLDVAPVPGPDDALPKQAQGGSGREWVVVGLVGVSRAARGRAERCAGGEEAGYTRNRRTFSAGVGARHGWRHDAEGAAVVWRHGGAVAAI